jgi:hypothetical protein
MVTVTAPADTAQYYGNAGPGSTPSPPSSGSGGSSGGGGERQGFSSSNPLLNYNPPPTEPYVSPLIRNLPSQNNRGFGGSSGGGGGTAPQPNQTTQARQAEIPIPQISENSVRIGETTYSGTAVIPAYNMTAEEMAARAYGGTFGSAKLQPQESFAYHSQDELQSENIPQRNNFMEPRNLPKNLRVEYVKRLRTYGTKTNQPNMVPVITQDTRKYKTAVVNLVNEEGTVVGRRLISLGPESDTERIQREVIQSKTYRKIKEEMQPTLQLASTGYKNVKKLPENAVEMLSIPRRRLGITDEMTNMLIGVGIPFTPAYLSGKQLKEQIANVGKKYPYVSPVTDIASYLVPTTPEEVIVKGAVAYGGYKVLAEGLTTDYMIGGRTIRFSPQVTRGVLLSGPLKNIQEPLTSWQPSNVFGQAAKGAAELALWTRFPSTGIAQTTEFGKTAIKQPVETAYNAIDYIIQNPAEVGTIAFGGTAAKLGEYALLRTKAPMEIVHTTKYGDIRVQKVPKYGEIIWVDDARFSQTEKLGIIDQINRLRGAGQRTFVSVSPQGIPVKMFSNRKGFGFEVSQISKPMRGYYEAPPWKFLETVKQLEMQKYKAGAASYYAGNIRERGNINPIDYFKELITGAEFSNQRPMQTIRRTGKGIETPDWIYKNTVNLEKGKGIHPAARAMIDKYYKEFLKRPFNFNGVDYVGAAKSKILSEMNLKNRGGSFDKLKTYFALMEYQFKNKVQLAGGAEGLSSIHPYGPESQVVSAIGTRLFLKPLKDLRKAKVQSFGEMLIEKVTGIKRGEAASIPAGIFGGIVEIQPVRAFPGRVRAAKGAIRDAAKVSGETISDLLYDPGRLREAERGRLRTPRNIPRVSPSRRIEERSLNEFIIGRTRSEQPRREMRPQRIMRAAERRVESPRERDIFRDILPEIRTEVPRERPRRMPTRIEPPRIIIPTPRRRGEPTTPRFQGLINERRKRLVAKKEIKKGPKYRVMPTVFELSIGTPSRVAKKGKITGFEAFRMISG